MRRLPTPQWSRLRGTSSPALRRITTSHASPRIRLRRQIPAFRSLSIYRYGTAIVGQPGATVREDYARIIKVVAELRARGVKFE